MKGRLAIAVALSASAFASARHDDVATDQHGRRSPQDAQIVITINPEARVSAVIGASLPPPPTCGSAIALTVRVTNQGFVTALLRAAIVGDGSQQVTMHLDETKLSGAPEDERTLHVISQVSPVDVTIAFSIDDNPGDLGGRDQVHFLLRCRESSD